jgi:hypothetical protein
MIVVLALSTHLHAADQEPWKVQVTGLRVVAPVAQKKNDNDRGAFFQPPGVTVVAVVTPAVGKVVDIEQFDSKIETFTDDKGTDLLAAKSDSLFNKPGFGAMDEKDGVANVEIQAAGVPARGATVLNITGTLAVKVATGTNQSTIESVEIKAGTSFKIGDVPVKISKAGMGKGMFSDKQEFTVTFVSSKDLECISQLEFFDSQGGKVESRKVSWGGGMGQYEMEFAFKQGVDRAKIIATCWSGMTEVKIPLTIKTGIGL